MNQKEENEMNTKEEKEQKLYERVVNAKTPEEKIKRAIKNFKREDKICSVILYLAPEVVGEGKSSILVSTLDDDYGTLSGQLQLDMMSNVRLRTFLMELVDMYRENRCEDDLIEDAFYWRDMHDVWCKLSEEKDYNILDALRQIAYNGKLSEDERMLCLGHYIDSHFSLKKGGKK